MFAPALEKYTNILCGRLNDPEWHLIFLFAFNSEAVAVVVVVAFCIDDVKATVGQQCYEAVDFGAKNCLRKLVPEGV
jgi:hypothetical protein